MNAPIKTLKSADDLVGAGLMPADQAAATADVIDRYAVSITPTVASQIAREEPGGPIGRQFVPSKDELTLLPEERGDPIGDEAHSPVHGIVHRHADRVLLKIVAACPVYCRFCFRREMVGPGEGALSPEETDAAISYIGDHPEIWEVILTGGDPFMLSPRRINQLTKRLAEIDHVKVVRWHTRVPTVDPGRVSQALIDGLTGTRLRVVVALHINHASELIGPAREAVDRLRRAGIPLISQTVLLRGVNNTLDALSALMRGLVEAGITPYYLHHPDLAPGTSHFRLTIEEGQALVRGLRERISGLCQPTYVVDIPGGVAKVPAGPNYLSPAGGNINAAQFAGKTYSLK